MIKPYDDWTYWDKSAEDVHGISRQQLQQYGSDGITVCLEINAFLSGADVFSDGWVVDSPWIIKLYEAAHMQMAFRISALEMILKEQQMRRWHVTKNAVIQSLQLQRHRASNDALIIQKTYEQTLTTATSV